MKSFQTAMLMKDEDNKFVAFETHPEFGLALIRFITNENFTAKVSIDDFKKFIKDAYEQMELGDE